AVSVGSGAPVHDRRLVGTYCWLCMRPRRPLRAGLANRVQRADGADRDRLLQSHWHCVRTSARRTGCAVGSGGATKVRITLDVEIGPLVERTAAFFLAACRHSRMD